MPNLESPGWICSPPLSAGLLFRDPDSKNLDAMDEGRGRAPVEAATTCSLRKPYYPYKLA